MTRRDLRVTIATTLNIRGWGQQPSCQPHRLPHRRMSTQHALLISLIEKPSSGYDLARRFDKSIGYFWHATHQQIYRELGRMAELGWIAAAENAGAAAAGQGDGVEKKTARRCTRCCRRGATNWCDGCCRQVPDWISARKFWSSYVQMLQSDRLAWIAK